MSAESTSPNLVNAVASLQRYAEIGHLTRRIAALESSLSGMSREDAVNFILDEGIEPAMLAGAVEIKRIAGEVNVAIHSLGLLLSLSEILEPQERVLRLSLGAGNSGREHDLETNLQIAEFKFIDWRGGAESIRQNSLFVDIFRLAKSETDRRKIVYLTSLEHPLRFLQGRRAIGSVLSKNASVAKQFDDMHGGEFRVVSDYWKYLHGVVELVDLTAVAPGLPEFRLASSGFGSGE